MAKTVRRTRNTKNVDVKTCEACRKAPSVYHITTIKRGKPSTRHLCEKCARPYLAAPVPKASQRLEVRSISPQLGARSVVTIPLPKTVAKGAAARRAGEILGQSVANKARLLLSPQINTVGKIADALVRTLKRDKCVYIMGNGGSAADAQHFAAELVGRFKMERRGLPAIAFTTDTSCLTAVGNDYGFDNIFVRQVEALVRKGDAVIGITTSGNSPNVVQAVQRAKKVGATTIGFTGEGGGELAKLCDLCLKAPGDGTDRIQECHITVIHTLCQIIEEKLFGDAAKPKPKAKKK